MGGTSHHWFFPYFAIAAFNTSSSVFYGSMLALLHTIEQQTYALSRRLQVATRMFVSTLLVEEDMTVRYSPPLMMIRTIVAVR